MKFFLLLFLLLIGLTNAAGAEVEFANNAYQRGDYQTAFQEFRRLAQQGNAEAQYRLGLLYVRGEGTIQDYVQAHKWLNLAASQGHRQAQKLRDDITAQMTREQIAEAQQLARAWEPVSVTKEMSTPPFGSSSVLEIQTMLNQLGYEAGRPDGQMGSQTRSAIRAYQQDYDLPATGEISQGLLNHLQRTVANKPPEWRPEPEYSPWRQVLQDRFRDGNYTRDPKWTVAQGKFWIEPGLGLRSVVTPPPLPVAERQGEVRPEDVGVALLGMVLERVLESKGQGQQPSPGDIEPEFAEIYLNRTFANSFQINLQFHSQQDRGALIFGPYQGARREQGYRLVYLPGASRGLELVRLSASGHRVIQTYERPLHLEDGRMHNLQWIRNPNGEMVVTIDDQERLRVVDRGIRGSFRGFTWLNRGGDYALNEVRILVTR